MLNIQSQILKEKNLFKRRSNLKNDIPIINKVNNNINKTQNNKNILLLDYSIDNTVSQGKENDNKFLITLQKLAQNSNTYFNPLKIIEKQLTELDLQQIALAAQRQRNSKMPCICNLNEQVKQKKNNKVQNSNIKKLNKICQCQSNSKKSIQILIQQQRLNFMGPGIILYFFFIKMLIILTGLGVLIFAIFAIAANLQGKLANQQVCNNNQYCQLKVLTSLQNVKSNDLIVEIANWLAFVMCIAWIIVLRIVKFKAKILNQNIDLDITTPSDTAIKIENLPYGGIDELQIIEVMNENWAKNYNQLQNQDNTDLQIKSIQIVYNMEKIRNLIYNIRKLSIQLKSQLDWEKDYGRIITDQQSYIQTKNKLIDSIQLIQDLKKKFFIQTSYRRKLATTCAIIQFQSQSSKNRFLKKFGNKHLGLIDLIWQKFKSSIYSLTQINFFKIQINSIHIKGRKLSIQRAPQPQDINWTNCQVQYSAARVAMIYVISLFIIFISLAVVIGLNYIQQIINSYGNKQNTLSFINYIISFLLMLINQILLISLDFLVKYEYNHTLSQQILSMINKTVFTQFLNSVIVPLISDNLIQNKFYGPDGVAGTVFDFSISNTMVFVVLVYFDPTYYAKKILLSIKCARNKIIKYFIRNVPKQDKVKNNKSVNQFYQSPDIDITKSYIYLTVVILHSSFYCLLQPLIMIIAFIGFILFFYVKKYLLLRRYSYPKMIQKYVFDTILIAVSFAPLLNGIGSLIFLQIIYKDYKYPMIPCILTISVSILNILNPGKIFDKLTAKFYELRCLKKLNFIQKLQKQKNRNEKKQKIQKKQLNQNEIGDLNDNKMTQNNNNEQQQQEKCSLKYYHNNHISTLLGYKNLLNGLDIDNYIRNEVKQFVQNFGHIIRDPCQYPQEIESGIGIKISKFGNKL